MGEGGQRLCQNIHDHQVVARPHGRMAEARRLQGGDLVGQTVCFGIGAGGRDAVGLDIDRDNGAWPALRDTQRQNARAAAHIQRAGRGEPIQMCDDLQQELGGGVAAIAKGMGAMGEGVHGREYRHNGDMGAIKLLLKTALYDAKVMQQVRPQSLSTPLIAIAYDTYAAATQAPRNDFDATDRLNPVQNPQRYLLFTGVGDPEHVWSAKELHQGFLGIASEGVAHSEENRQRLFMTDACYPLTVSQSQGQRVKMLASEIDAPSPEALKAAFPHGNVQVMDTVAELRHACDSLQVHQRAGLLQAGGLGALKKDEHGR